MPKKLRPSKTVSRNKRTRRVQPLTKPSDTIRAAYPFLDDFFAYDWKHIPERHAYGAYALSLFANLPDYVEVAVDALTEGSDDKDVDLCLVDREAGQIYIAQSYLADEWDQPAAPSNKADDLLTGLSWILNARIEDVPEALRKKAQEVQDALRSGDIQTVHLLYIHNCRESDNVRASLATVAASAKTLIQQDAVSACCAEIGLPELQHLYESLTKQIVVDRAISFDVTEQMNEVGNGWKAVATTISGVVLHDLWQKYRDDLFSANIRGFLDMLRRKASINRGILETVQREPSSFWAYNNGVTILTKKITRSNGKLVAQGVSVINGAQTTGVLGNAPRESAAKVRVLCRFIESGDRDLIDQIIESNNTQNAIKSFDFRSNDPTQRRLKLQFQKYGITYLHRRQGAARLPPGAIQAEVVAPHLAAFHGQFQTAVRQRRAIFEDRSIYGSVFPAEISAEHVYLVESLAESVARSKIEVQNRVASGTANDPEKAMNGFYGYSTAKFFVVAVVGQLAQQVFGSPIPDLFTWSVRPAFVKPDREPVVARWKTVVDGLVPLIVGRAGDDLYETVRSTGQVEEVAKNVSYLLQSLRDQFNAVMSPIRDVTELR